MVYSLFINYLHEVTLAQRLPTFTPHITSAADLILSERAKTKKFRSDQQQNITAPSIPYYL